MDIYQRMKILRKDQHLSQEAFGTRLGVSRAVINNLERNLYVNSNSYMPLVKLAAKEFAVSEEWLLHGESDAPQYLSVPELDVFAYLKGHGFREFEASFIAAYLSLNPKEREAVLTFFERILTQMCAILLRLKAEAEQQ